MHLKRLEIQGFKTFATRTVFEFRPGITAIIGANGSGKSNLLEAVRWVLGEQSYGSLRSKRTEDLIFSGGGRRAPAGLAEVALTIDNSDRLLPLPYGEVTIARRATRSGENEYFINRNRVRLRDVQEAVAPLGGSYTIVTQGLVDAALALRPEERRRLFEDAAAIGVFESRKAEAERRLREAEANLERCADIAAELEPRLRALKRQAAAARTHRALSEELHTLLCRHYGMLWQAACRDLAVAETAERHLAEELRVHRAARAAVSAELEQARAELRALRAQLEQRFAERAELQRRAEALGREVAVDDERGTALARHAEELARGRNEQETRREELARGRAEAATRLAEQEERAARLRAEAQAIENAIAAHEQQRRGARAEIEAAQRAEIEAAAALAELRRRAGRLADQRARLAQEQAGSTKTLGDAEAALESRRLAIEAARAHADAAARALEAASAAAEQARAELETIRAGRARAEEDAALARRALADTEARLETLSRLQRSYAGAFAGVKAAMQWAEAQGRAGFALVSTIVHAPPQLETAIEVALGARLQHIVVERWDDAEAAIEALKRGGAGRATFLPLDTIRPSSPPSSRSALNDAGLLGVAADLVEYDERYAAVVWMLLGRTLIVRDLPAAQRLLRSLRSASAPSAASTLVTLGGEQVSVGGAVTGGAQVKESGALRRERELRELPPQIAEQRAALERALQASAASATHLAAAEAALREAVAAERHAAHERKTAQEALERASRAMERAEAEIAWHRRRHDQSAAESAEIARQDAALHDEQARLVERESTARAQLAELRAADQERDAAARADQERLAAARAAVAAAEGEARAQRALLQTHERELARIEQQLADSARRIEHLDREQAALEQRRHTTREAHAVLLASIAALQARIEPAEAERAARERAQAGLERREVALSTALIEGEAAHGRAAVALQRARDRRETLHERAAADAIDIETVARLIAEEPEPVRDSLDGMGEAADGALEVDQTRDLSQSGEENPIDLVEAIERLRERIRRLGAVNPLALEEYEAVAERHTFLTSQIDDLRRAEESLRELIATLDATMQARFEATFHAIAAEFERSFTRLFGGGQASLLLTRPKHSDGQSENGNGVEETSAGVEILARPPGKRQQPLALLSGGERSLTAAALLFAILKVNPSPFCILDEVDAALDEANVGRFREALAELARQTQFLIITHNRGTIEVADTIYGVSMGDDSASRVLSLRLEELIEE